MMNRMNMDEIKSYAVSIWGLRPQNGKLHHPHNFIGQSPIL